MVEIRIAGSVLHAVALAWWFPRLFPQFRLVVPTREVMARVMSFSGFAYLNKLASLTYAHADKLIIGSLLGMEAVTIYTVPATLINRFLGLTFRLSSVIFPAASHMAAVGDWERLRVVYLASSRYITFVNGVIVALSLLLGRELLHYWIGGDVAQQGWNVFVMIGLAMFVESLTNLPSLVNDGLGHARASGLFAMSRAILGLLLTWALASTSGIDGVAAGHLLASVCIGAAFIFYAHGRTVPFSAAVYLRDGLGASLLFVGAPALLIWALRPQALLSLSHTLLLGTACGALFALIGLSAIVDKEDRSNFFRKLQRLNLKKGKS